MRLLNSSSGARAVLPHPRRHRSTCHAGGSARARRPPAPQCRRGRGRTEEGRAGPGGARANRGGRQRGEDRGRHQRADLSKKADLPSIGASPVAYGRPPGSREQFTQQAAARAEVRQPPPPWHASAGGGGGRLLAQVAARESERGETKKIQAEVIAQDTRQDTRLFRRQRPATWPPKPQGTRVPLPRDCREHGAMQGRPATPGRLY
ncbi:unnamed protein product [Prorocentrum cordatum]|uniref:Uncharacterized protein n=1 Tax=Prorocentrum cordatum TaxID=2364126 RepID=A0ABN9TRS0_9DINO|nr:unnamed protein product [Polarella glacialis]